MRQLVLLLTLGAGACGPADNERSTAQPPALSETVQIAQDPASRSAAVLPKPADPAQLDRMILAGYTPHADHLHRPGVNKCPLTKGTDAVM